MMNNTLSDEWKAGAVSMVMVLCLALQAIIKDQVEPLNQIGVARTALGINEKKKPKEPESARLCVNTFRLAEFDTFLICHADFMLS